MRFSQLTDEQKEKIKSDYLSGKSSYKIADEISASEPSILEWLRRLEVSIRNLSESKRRYTLNQSVFNEITSDSAYWIGFLMADGCVRRNKRSIVVNLSLRDEVHLYKLKEFLGYSGSIWRSKGQIKYSLLCFFSVRLAERLISYGVTPHKSLTAKVIGLEDNRDFWRGVCDGDGTICFGGKNSYLPGIGIYGSKNLMEQFAIYVRKVVPTAWGNLNKDENTYKVMVHGNKALVLMKNLYKDASTYLDRKYELAKRLTGNFSFEDKYNEGHEESIQTTTNDEVEKEG